MNGNINMPNPAEEKRASAQAIVDSVEYLENEFLKPLVRAGEELVDASVKVRTSLQHPSIDGILMKNQSILETNIAELKKIIENAKVEMAESSHVVEQSIEEIADTITG